MEIYIDECQDEVGWLGFVTKVEEGVFLCTEVNLPHQEVHGATTELTGEGLVKFAEEVGFERIEHARLWGHSHVNGGTDPSSQDEKQMGLFKRNGFDWFFRIICNKRGVLSVHYFNYAHDIVIEDIQWDTYYPVDVSLDDIKEEILAKVKKKTYAMTTTSTAIEKLPSKIYDAKTDTFTEYASYGDYLEATGKTAHESTKKKKTKAEKKAEKAAALAAQQAEEEAHADDWDDIIDILETSMMPMELYEMVNGTVDYSDDWSVRTILHEYSWLTYSVMRDYLCNHYLGGNDYGLQ